MEQPSDKRAVGPVYFMAHGHGRGVVNEPVGVRGDELLFPQRRTMSFLQKVILHIPLRGVLAGNFTS